MLSKFILLATPVWILGGCGLSSASNDDVGSEITISLTFKYFYDDFYDVFSDEQWVRMLSFILTGS